MIGCIRPAEVARLYRSLPFRSELGSWPGAALKCDCPSGLLSEFLFGRRIRSVVAVGGVLKPGGIGGTPSRLFSCPVFIGVSFVKCYRVSLL